MPDKPGAGYPFVPEVFVCEPVPGIRYCIERVLRVAGVELVGSSGDPSPCLDHPEARGPVIYVVDQSPDGTYGPDVIESLLATDRTRRVVVYSAYDYEPVITTAFEAGASSFVSKSATSQKLFDAILAAFRQGTACDHQTRPQVFLPLTNFFKMGDRADDSPHQILTVRELAIFMMISEGLTIKEVADRLDVGERTVGNRLLALRRRLNIPRERLRLHAIEHCLITVTNAPGRTGGMMRDHSAWLGG